MVHLLVVGYYHLADGFLAFAELARARGHRVSFFPLLHYANEGVDYQTDLLRLLDDPTAEVQFDYHREPGSVEVVIWWGQVGRLTPTLATTVKARCRLVHFNWDPTYLDVDHEKWNRDRATAERQVDLFDSYLTVNPLEYRCLSKLVADRARGSHRTTRVCYCPPGFNPNLHKPTPDPAFVCDVSFVGTNLYTDDLWPTERQRFNRGRLLDLLHQEPDLDLRVYGTSVLAKYGDRYKGFIQYAETPKVFYNSKVNICLHAITINGYFSERLPQIIGCGGGVVLTDTEVGHGLVAGEDYVLIDPEDPVGQIRRWLTDDEGRRAMAERAYRKSRALTWDNLVNLVCESDPADQ